MMITGQDITKARISYDEARDIGRMDHDETSLISLGVGFILGAALVGIVSTWIHIEDAAPTAAEVSASCFNLVAKQTGAFVPRGK